MKKDLRKVESAILLGLLLLPGLLIALPAVSVIGVSAYSGTPAAVTGATVSIDYPIFAGISTTVQSDSRVITINNPAGNPGITTITISVPAAAVSAAPTGYIPTWGGVPDCASKTCKAQVFGSGPYSIQYVDNTSSGAVILPGGASISVVIGLTPETETTSSGAADTFQLSSAVTDTGGANTVLNSMTIYETRATSATVTNPSSLTQKAGTPFTFTASVNQTALPLTVYTNGTTSTTTLTPPSFTSGSSAQTISVNDTTAENITLSVGGPVANSHSLNGLLGNGTTSTINVKAGAPTMLTVGIIQNGVSYTAATTKQVNITSTSQALISAADIWVATTDNFGNAAPFGTATSITLTTSSLLGQTAGFTNESTYTTGNSGVYPFNPSDLLQAVTISMSAVQDNKTSNSKFFVSPDYGSKSLITASASGITGTSSPDLVTWALNSTYGATVTVNGSSSAISINAGDQAVVKATLPFPQAGVPIYFMNESSSTYAGSFASTGSYATLAATSVINSTSHQAYATVNLIVDTTEGATTQVGANYSATPTTFSPLNKSPVITTGTGIFASLVINTFFNAGPLSGLTTSASPGGVLYVNVSAADAYGNALVPTKADVQLSLTAAHGALSVITPFIYKGNESTYSSGFTIQYVAPTSLGTDTISATGTYQGVTATGSTTVNIVSAIPTVVVTSAPNVVTTGTPQTITGWANATKGLYNAKITTLQYSLNGGTPVNIASGQATNQFSITILLQPNNILNITAVDNYGNSYTLITQIPTLSPAKTFTNSSNIVKITFPNGPQALNATFTNHAVSTLTVIVIGQVYENISGSFVPLSPPVSSTLTNVPSTASASAYLLLQGFAPGTYRVDVTVYSLQYVTLSPTTSVTVTIS